MPMLNWAANAARYYDFGVDRGVLFLGDNPGIAWPGLTSIDEAPTGGEARSYYVDGYKYLHIAAYEEYAATIEAITAPVEFAACDGMGQVQNGLFATMQPRIPFSFSYRSSLGNELAKVAGHKLHIVYDALAAPSGRNHKSLGGTGDVDLYSWSVTTKPPKITGRRPTSHFVIDSRYTPESLFTHINDVLYGSETDASRLPGAQELIDMFTNWV